MKKILFAVLLISITLPVAAQFKKGNWLMEGGFGNINFNNSKSKNFTSGAQSSGSNGNSFSISLYPRAGYFISDNFVIGTEVYIYINSSKSTSKNASGAKSSEYKSSNPGISIAPFARYYFNGTSKSRFFAQLAGGFYTDLKYDYESKSYNPATGALISTFKYDYKKQYSNIYGNALLGWSYFVAPNAAINLTLGYRLGKTGYTYTYTTTPVSGSAITSPEFKYESNSNSVTWGTGIMIILPGKNKK